MRIRHRAHAQTYQHTVEIELSCHKGYGATLEAEVEYSRTADVPAQIFGPPERCWPAEGGEVEITAIRPFRMIRVKGQPTRTELLDAPRWLLDLIQDCIDPSYLTGDDE